MAPVTVGRSAVAGSACVEWCDAHLRTAGKVTLSRAADTGSTFGTHVRQMPDARDSSIVAYGRAYTNHVHDVPGTRNAIHRS